uniref:Glycosyltransferase n=2 Tax=viral metagenome TaxID=1070528 RepID=A0A6M3K372_9ZZZZ
MSKISVIYLTKNKYGIDILKDNLKRQTLQDYEVILADELDRKVKGWKCFKPKPPKKGCVWNLNSAYNEAIDMVSGKLTVFLQDYIWIPDDSFEKLWHWYIIYKEDAAVCTGGTSGTRPTFKEYRASCLKPYNLKEDLKTGIEEVGYNGYEINFAMFPSKRLKEIRFEEGMDRWYSGDCWILAYKAIKEGMKFFIDYDIRKIGFPDYFGKPEYWERDHFNKWDTNIILKMLFDEKKLYKK